jgi:hypothetical protein
MADPIYNIWIRSYDTNPADPKLKREELVTVYSKLEFKIVYNNVGGWTLTMPGGIAEANLLKSLLIGTPGFPNNTAQGYGGIVVTRNGTIVFSGPVRGFTETGDYTGPKGKEIEFWGIDDTGYLNSRIPMVPAPATTGSAPAGTGVAEGEFVAPFFKGWPYYIYPSGAARPITQIMRNFVIANIGSAAPYNLENGFQNRRIPFLDVTFTDPDVASGPENFISRSRYAGTILEKIQEAATYITPGYQGLYAGSYRGAAFRVIQTSNDRLNCMIWDPRGPNHNKGVVFSAGRGNLGAYKYTHQAPEVNFSVVGGQADDNDGERTGTSRWFEHRGAQQGDSINRYGLWEGYIDRRDIQYDTPITNNPPNANYIAMTQEMINAMDVQLREQGEQVHIEVTALNVPPTTWPDDYNVGDIVKVVIDNYQYDEVVRDVTVTLTKDEGEVVRPTIGTEATGMTVRLFEKFNQVDSSINNLNASQ